MKKNTIIFALFLFVGLLSKAQINTFPWTEDFETAELPSGWTQEYVNASINWVTYNGGSYGMPSSAFSSTKNAFFASDNYDDNQTILISPQLDLSALTNPVLSFYHTQIPFDTDQDELYVYYKTSATGSWILLESYTSAILNWTQHQIIIPEISADFYIGFSAKSGYGLGICLDQVVVANQEPCLAPGNVSVIQTSDSGAVVNWTAGGSESQWQIEYGLQGYTQGGGTIITTPSHPYTFTSLSANEDYDFYIRSFCNPLYSDWAGPFSFSTVCTIADIFPYNEGFENATAPVPCWKTEYANSNPNSGNLISHSTQFAYEGSRSVKFSSYYIGAPYNQYLISREFDFPQEMQLSFRYRKNTSGTEVFCVGTSSTNGNVSSFTWSDNVSNATTSWKYFSFNVPANTKFIAIQYKSNFQNSLFVDDLQIRNAAGCYEPVDVNISGITSGTALLSWTSVNEETSWIIEYGTAGFTQGLGNIVTTGLNPYTISGLDSETEYDVYIKADCGESESIVAEKQSFTTLPACLPVTGLSVTANTNNSVSLSWVSTGAVFYEIEYGNTGFAQGSGTIVSSIVTNSKTISGLTENTSYDFYVRAYCGATNGYSDWSSPVNISTYPCADGCFYTFLLSDYWGDGWGNVSLSVYQNGDLTNTLSLASGYSQENQVFICNGADVDVVLNQGSFANECAFKIYTPYNVFVYSGELETLGSLPDQTILHSFTGDCSEPACYPPVDPEYSQLSYSSCILTWNTGNNETSWNIEYGASGFIPGSGIFINGITEQSYPLNGLTPAMSYDVYIYSDCNASGFSDPAGPVSFTTLSAPLGLDVCGLNINIPDNSFTMVNFEVTGLVPSNSYTHFNLESVSFIIQHPYDGDVEMYLESPEGVMVTLIQDNGATGDNFGDVSGTCSYKTMLSLNPVNGSIASGTAPFNGNYSAIGNIGAYNTGADLNGLWKLKLVDDNNLYTGKLQYFNLSFAESKALVATSNTFFEGSANNGSIDNIIILDLYNETFVSTGLLTEGTDFIAENVPAGLNIKINITGTNTAEISLTGNAVSHATDIENLIIRLGNAVFTGADADDVDGSEQIFTIDFLVEQNITNNSIDDIVICADESAPVFVPYSFTNNGETIIDAGTQISMILEYPAGTPALTEDLTLVSDLEIGESVNGNFSNPLFFGTANTYTVKTIAELTGENNTSDNETLINYIAVTHYTEFPQASGDTIYVTEFPYSVSTTAVFDPVEYTQTLYYFWNGETGSSSFDAIAEGWIYLNTESSYCNISDSVYIALISSGSEIRRMEFNIYPNPAEDIIIVNSPENLLNRIIICGIDGRIYTEEIIDSQNNSHQISVSELSAGLYFIIAETSEGTFKKNFIKL